MPGSKGRRTRTALRPRFSSRKQLFSDEETHETLPASWSDEELALLLEFILLRSGLMLIAESGVKRRSNISWTLGHNVLGYSFVTLLTQLQSRVPSRTPAIFHNNTSNLTERFSRCTTETKLLLTLTFSMVYELIYICIRVT